MVNHICTTCGTQYEDAGRPPAQCRICSEERQYLGWGGQRWTTLDEMGATGFKNAITPVRRGLHQIITRPAFGIGQRCFLATTAAGNVLWDCVTHIDDDTVDEIRKLGGVDCIAISHPHFYSAMVEWSDAFDGAPIFVHHLDRKWVQRKSRSIVYWKGKTIAPMPDAEVINLGGHFAGSSVLRLQGKNFEKGVLLAGDTIFVVMDRRWVSFMYSYPNYIPLPARTVKALAARMRPYRYEDLFSGFEGREILGAADRAVQSSARRYLRHLRS